MVPGHLPTGGVLEVDLPPRTWIHQICRDAGIPVTDRRSGAGRRQIVLATNRNGGMLRLNALRHDDDDDDDQRYRTSAENGDVTWRMQDNTFDVTQC